MPRKEVSEHFATYTENNRIKHAILTKYLSAYLKALSNWATAFHYIDGFAGRGNYAGVPGSPLQAIEVLASQRLPFSVSLVEADPGEAEELRKAVLSRKPATNQFDQPMVEAGEFATLLPRILARPIYGKFRDTATFAFVDPCRVSGYGSVDIRAVLRKPYGECLLFWNYEGVNRWLGAIAATDYDRSGLTHLFGSDSALLDALQIVQSAQSPTEKERALLSHFLHCMNEYSGAKFLIPFRFNAEGADRTGHYLIHCSNHSLAFKIMKDVMASLSSSAEPGQFAFLRRSELGNQLSMFIPEEEAQAIAAIRNELAKGTRPVRLFAQEWILRPGDLLRTPDYKRILLGMESAGIIEVLDERGMPRKAGERRRNSNGTPTLGDKLLLRVAEHRN